MARPPFSLSRAKKLAARIIKDDDAHVEELIELFVKTSNQNASAMTDAIRAEVLKTWYNQTQHYREGFRQYLERFEQGEEGAEEEDDVIEAGPIQSNGPAS